MLDGALKHLVPTFAVTEDWEWRVSEIATAGLGADSIPSCATY